MDKWITPWSTHRKAITALWNLLTLHFFWNLKDLVFLHWCHTWHFSLTLILTSVVTSTLIHVELRTNHPIYFRLQASHICEPMRCFKSTDSAARKTGKCLVTKLISRHNEHDGLFVKQWIFRLQLKAGNKNTKRNNNCYQKNNYWSPIQSSSITGRCFLTMLPEAVFSKGTNKDRDNITWIHKSSKCLCPLFSSVLITCRLYCLIYRFL